LAVKSGKLAVCVGHAYFVEVNQGDSPDSASGQGFGRPGTDPANAQDRDMRMSHFGEGVGSVKSGEPGEPVEIISWKGFGQIAAPCVEGRLDASSADEKSDAMKWQILTIGKPSLAYAKHGVEEYLKRLGRYTSLELQTDWKDNGSQKNSEALLAASEGSIRIVLDERGEPWSTSDFVERVEAWQMRGVKRVAVLIGGADGHTPALRKAADHVVAMSGFTLQHELALVVLLEQIYRVHTVIKGEPYHR